LFPPDKRLTGNILIEKSVPINDGDVTLA